MNYDLIVRNVRLVTHESPQTVLTDIAVTDGRVAAVGHLGDATATTTVDGGGKLALPGVVDAHQHWGIYNPLEIDAETESKAAAQGGVTTGLNYIRTGQYYLNKSGAYRDFFPEVLERTQGRAYIDYAFHLAPMSKEHISEIPELIEEHGVSSFKIFMFYGGYGLHGRSADQSSFLMTPEGERYDLAHFEFVMRGIQAARNAAPQIADSISLSLHCETAEIMSAYTAMVEQEGQLTGLEAYSASRPAHSEGLAISIASYLAHETQLANINLLHLSGRKAVEAALLMARTFPHINFRREVTIGHLVADYHSASGIGGKVNPPLRSRDDVEGLWEHVLAGEIDWVVSDHACCRDEMKFGSERDNVFVAKSGFGGAEYLLPALISEGRKRGLGWDRIAALTAWNPAERYGLSGRKGVIKVGYDADFCLVDDSRSWTVRAEDSLSTQEYTPFEGFELSASVTDTFVRGHHVFVDGAIQGEPRGEYQRRPLTSE
ncbi:dihydroorotase [Micromonospora profundi]|uniref:Dihydroorotase family protein n=1 Tax=Micromonospora profundi TaxID=1420889 RepID=A0AAJ6I0G7_9ACTN|nr:MULTISPECIES: dihydroorotase family protein [Micromonospora]KOX10637.1 hydantoinase [Micromonospora sp. NRRL B-16802]NJC10733.1 allantoinase [Micromonospora profundi]WLS48248.1 dihydroorotase family protein [Micromonospora profundi]